MKNDIEEKKETNIEKIIDKEFNKKWSVTQTTKEIRNRVLKKINMLEWEDAIVDNFDFWNKIKNDENAATHYRDAARDRQTALFVEMLKHKNTENPEKSDIQIEKINRMLHHHINRFMSPQIDRIIEKKKQERDSNSRNSIIEVEGETHE